MLTLDRLHVYIETSHILKEVTLSVGERECVCVIGRNGAGKTTLLRTIMGYLRPQAGTITLHGRSLVRCPLGCGPDGPGVFPRRQWRVW